MGAEQMRQHRCGRTSVSESFMRPIEADRIPVADIAEPMGQFAIGIEPTGHPQGAESTLERCDRHRRGSASPGVSNEELAIEASVVSNEERIAQPLRELIENVVQLRRPAQHRSCDAVNVGRTDATERPPKLHEGLPLIVDHALAINRHHCDLQHTITPDIETGRLKIDHCESREGHVAHLTQGVLQGHRGVRRRLGGDGL